MALPPLAIFDQDVFDISVYAIHKAQLSYSFTHQ